MDKYEVCSWSLDIFKFPSFYLARLNASNIHQNERYQLNSPKQTTKNIDIDNFITTPAPWLHIFREKSGSKWFAE